MDYIVSLIFGLCTLYFKIHLRRFRLSLEQKLSDFNNFWCGKLNFKRLFDGQLSQKYLHQKLLNFLLIFLQVTIENVGNFLETQCIMC